MEPLSTMALVGFYMIVAGRLMVRHATTRPENLARHPVRAQILQTLDTTPGLNVSELCREVGRPWGTLQHHLYLLRKANLIQDVALGRDHRYFPGATQPDEARRIAILRQSRVWDFVHEVLQDPGVRQRRITQRIGMSRKVVRGYVDLLKGAGLLDEERPSSKSRVYFPTEALKTTAARAFPHSGDETHVDVAADANAPPADEPANPGPMA